MNTRFLADTNCLIATMVSAHVHHQLTIDELDRRRSLGEQLVVAAHSLIEAYAVLTRLPEHRLPPPLAHRLITTNFMAPGMVVALDPAEYGQVLELAAATMVTGGRLYDAVIAACARKAGARTLLTWNRRHFAEFADATLEVVVPGDSIG